MADNVISPKRTTAGSRAVPQCMGHRWGLALLTAFFAVLLLPAGARADGPVTPVATSYQARIGPLPDGIQGKVVDGYLQLWLKVPARETVVVLDYQGAPWVRFDRAGVAVNENSQMYYLSQVPVPATPPSGLTRSTPPHWVTVSSGHAYMWRDGRLHAFTTISLPPGTSYVGQWRIPLRIDGRAVTISGGVWHKPRPSIVWFWPIVVLVACALAAWRVRRASLDERIARGLALTLLAALVVADVAHELHGRPSVSAGQVVLFALLILLVGAATARVLLRRAGYPLMFVIAFVSLWAGLTLAPTLLKAYVQLAVPGFLARTVTAVLLGGGLSLVLVAVRLLDLSSLRSRGRRSANAVA